MDRYRQPSSIRGCEKKVWINYKNSPIFTNKMKQKRGIFFFISVIVLLLLSIWLLKSTEDRFFNYDLRWYPCIEYIENGELYGGHLECAQGPVIFYLGYFYKSLFGPPQENLFHIAIFFTMVGIALLSFLLIIKTLRYYGYKDIILPWFLFIIIAAMNPKIDHWMAMIFFFSGFYTLYIWEWKHKEYISAILFSLGIATKATLLSPMAFLFAHYLFKEKIIAYKESKFVLSKEKLKKFIKIPIIITVFVVSVIAYYPNVLIHAFITHFNQLTKISLLETFKRALFTFQVRNYFIYGIVALTTYLFIKTKRVYYLLISIPILMITFSLLKNGLKISDYLRGNLYLYILLVFFPIAFTAMKYDFRKYLPNYRYAYFPIIILLFVWPSYIPSHLSNTLDYYIIPDIKENEETKLFLKSAIQGVLSVVPEQTGKVLFEYGDTLGQHLEERKASFKEMAIVNPDDDYFGKREFYDHWNAIPMRRMLGEQHEEWLRTHPPKNLSESGMTQLENEFRNLSFSLIIEGPPQWVVTSNMLRDNADTLQKNYCAVIVPDYTYVEPAGRHHRTFYFLNQSHCLIMMENTITYYSSVFESICNIDQYIANNIVLAALSMNGVSFETACSSGADWLSRRGGDPAPDANEKMQINKKREIIFLISIIILLFMGLSIRRKKV